MNDTSSGRWGGCERNEALSTRWKKQEKESINACLSVVHDGRGGGFF